MNSWSFGNIFPVERITGIAYNRTGAALDLGDLAALNLDFVNTSYDDLDGSSTDPRGNVVAVTTENAARVMVVALAAIASSAQGEFGLKGDFVVESNSANAGEFLHGTNAQTYATPLTKTELDSVTVPTGLIGVALAATSGAATGLARFDGEAWKHMVGGGG